MSVFIFSNICFFIKANINNNLFTILKMTSNIYFSNVLNKLGTYSSNVQILK